MSIPLDRLCHFLETASDEKDIIIYRFFPHGSKNLDDLDIIQDYPTDWYTRMTSPVMIMHDQEPLHFDLYTKEAIQTQFYTAYPTYNNQLPELSQLVEAMNLRACVKFPFSCYDYTLLCHSEKNSDDLKKYQDHGFLDVYYWCHALIARDWFRFAKHDNNLKFNAENKQYDFLIYNRAWSGTREYRLKMSELLVKHNLISQSKTNFNPVDDIHYTTHTFKNPKFQIESNGLEENIPCLPVSPTASADYNTLDYASCGIEVVLETLFDDKRIHLTEKILRPIACGSPFILASTPGSLKYLRSYGFETFNGLINEEYDTIQDPLERLEAIIQEMRRIANLPRKEKFDLWNKLYKISQKNKTLFFTDQWQQMIIDEYVDNLKSAMQIMEQNCTGKYWKEIQKITKLYPHTRNIEKEELPGRSLADRQRVVDWLAKKSINI